MKKLGLLLMAILLMGVAVGSANDRMGSVPRNQTGVPAESSDYLGVDYATTGFTTADVRMSSGESVFVGIIWSSNTAVTDRVTFFDSTSTVAGYNDTDNTPVFDVTLATHSYAAVSAGADVRSGLGGKWSPPAPMRFLKGIVARISVGTVNRVTLLYNRTGQGSGK